MSAKLRADVMALHEVLRWIWSNSSDPVARLVARRALLGAEDRALEAKAWEAARKALLAVEPEPEREGKSEQGP